MRRKGLGLIALTGLALGLAGCAHNDVLVFGTETKLGLDISASPAQGGAPQINVGFKRTEAVWMPLLVNGRGSVWAPCTQARGDRSADCTIAGKPSVSVADGKYQSTTTNTDTNVTTSDAYSVFASIGANMGGSGTGTEVKGNVGLAQFFATGLAAQNISSNKALVTALKIDTPDGNDSQARAVEAASGFTPEAKEFRDTKHKQVSTLQDCTSIVPWSSIVSNSGLPQQSIDRYKNLKISEIPDKLHGQYETIEILLKSATEQGCKS
jgi:hypothetical protein